MPAHLGPFTAVALLLLLAGGAKLVRPDGARRALRRAGVAPPAGAVRAVGAVEAGAAITAMTTGSRPAALAVAAVYAALVAVAWRLRRRRAGCGCFGDDTAPVTGLHLAVNAVGALVALAAAAWPVGGFATLVSGSTGGGVLVAALAVLVAVQLRLVLTGLASLPTVAAAGRR